MPFADIEKEISALTRFEKILLIEKISQMLLEEENPARYFDSRKAILCLHRSTRKKRRLSFNSFLTGRSRSDFSLIR